MQNNLSRLFVLLSSCFTLFLCLGCSPTPHYTYFAATAIPPIFVNDIYPRPNSQGTVYQFICVDLNMDALWEPGDENVTKDFTTYIVLRTQIDFDGKSVPIDQTKLWAGGGLSNRGYSISTYICLRVKFQQGGHTVSVRTTSTSNRQYTFTWSFNAHSTISVDDQPDYKIALEDYIIGQTGNSSP